MNGNENTSDKLPFLTRFFRAVSLGLKIPQKSESRLNAFIEEKRGQNEQK